MNFLGKQRELPEVGWCNLAAWVWGLGFEGVLLESQRNKADVIRRNSE